MRPALAALATLVVLDGLWLGVAAKGFYKARMGHLMAERVSWPAVAVVYLLLTLGLVLLVRPRAQAGTLAQAWGWGALYGLIVYGVYDATNQATLLRWPTALSLADACWGAFVCGAAAVALRAAL